MEKRRPNVNLRNLSSYIDMQTHAGRTRLNPTTLTLDLLTSRSMQCHSEVLQQSTPVPSLVLVAARRTDYCGLSGLLTS